LYLAQPPLYKVKRGKTEQYIQSDNELSQHLLGIGLAESQVFPAGSDAAIANADLRELLGHAQRCERLSTSMERRGIDARIVEAAADCGLTSVGANAEASARAEFERGLVACLEKTYPESLPIRVEWSQDAEHSRWKPTVHVPHTAVQRSVEFDQALLESPDYQRFIALSERARSIGDAPYRLVVGGDTRVIPSPRHLLAELLRIAGKGQYIQRYKGLGEMNPEQLWETTMDPTKRTLLHVRVEDGPEANQTFSILMGDLVEPRKEFIEKNALNVVNLDI
jgi:DNA gyrase subunit B